MYSKNLIDNNTQIRPFDIFKPKKNGSSYFHLSDIKNRVVTELFFEYFEINELVKRIGEKNKFTIPKEKNKKEEKIEFKWENKEDKKAENLKVNESNESKSKNTKKNRNKKGKWVNYDELF